MTITVYVKKTNKVNTDEIIKKCPGSLFLMFFCVNLKRNLDVTFIMLAGIPPAAVFNGLYYQIFKICCIKILIPVMPTQQQKPITRGFPPVLTSFMIFVFSPMAHIAITIKNLLNFLRGRKTDGEMPILIETVVMTDARTK